MLFNRYAKKELKQVILVRGDLKLPKGKLAAQSSHASVDAVLKSNKKIVKMWRLQGMKKVVLRVSGLKELKHCINAANAAGLTTTIITDAGKTVVEPGTITCGAIGPDEAEKIDEITGHLKTM
ncbi:peptidyl-tRNA hydrolase [Candidatus Woesearchaeota archaeon]|nr:MAG: peptidyl-tRNA hydrolase [Candidatus Woesearchaeota archaeon]